MPEHAPEKQAKAQKNPAAEKAVNPSEPRLVEPGPQPEIGGPEGPEPTRFGDWERNGRCIDF